mgnify:CR=1 FL=1
MLCFMYFQVAFSLCRDTTAYAILNRRTHVNWSPIILYTNEGPLVTIQLTLSSQEEVNTIRCQSSSQYYTVSSVPGKHVEL